jgi:hypothetical protein
MKLWKAGENFIMRSFTTYILRQYNYNDKVKIYWMGRECTQTEKVNVRHIWFWWESQTKRGH